MGVVITHIQGTSGDQVNPGGIGMMAYDIRRGHFKIYGGQHPELTSGLGGAGTIRYVRGDIIYDLTQRLAAHAGAGFYDLNGNGVNAQLISWGFGLADRMNKWLSVYVKFVQLRRTESAENQFLSSGTQSGREAVGNYYVVGFKVSAEAFRWSWQ